VEESSGSEGETSGGGGRIEIKKHNGKEGQYGREEVHRGENPTLA